MSINATWHLANKMPKNPTLDQRVKWHLDHIRHCDCRALDGSIKEEFIKRFTGTHREFWIYFNKNDHIAMAVWAKACALRVLPYFEEKYPHDSRPRHALDVLQDWIDTGEFHMDIIRSASLSAHAAAKEIKSDRVASAAAHAAGQAVATAHVVTHTLGPAIYALKAVPDPVLERQWQLDQLPDHLRPWIVKQLSLLESR